mmetsp:Transcript_140247/g.349608  ORF Transcript_140247/g.349608 Transcript_140247/m.349608 type:complete len:106 (+) Transcript_140247:34-351(+)
MTSVFGPSVSFKKCRVAGLYHESHLSRSHGKVLSHVRCGDSACASEQALQFSFATEKRCCVLAMPPSWRRRRLAGLYNESHHGKLQFCQGVAACAPLAQASRLQF